MKKKIMLFAIAFFILQILDLWLTSISLKSPEIAERNPLYPKPWFIPLKLSIIILIAPTMDYINSKSTFWANVGICIILGLYVFICANNAYWAFT